MTYFYNIIFTRETEISSLSLVSMAKFLVSFLSFEKSLRLNASDLCCYEARGNMLGNGIYGFSDPGKYISGKGVVVWALKIEFSATLWPTSILK